MNEQHAAYQCSSFEYSSSESEIKRAPTVDPRRLKSSLNIIRILDSDKQKKK